MDNMKKLLLSNLRIIRESKNLSQEALADLMQISQAQYARFERGATKTDLATLEKFCKCVSFELIDLITYPEKFINIKDVSNEEPVQAILQIKLTRDKKDQVLKLVFGENNLEILNK